jgi:ribosomal protein S18 acetylase RimI-like enzyme
MKIRVFDKSDSEKLKEITIICFDGLSSIDHNIEKLCGRVGGKDWVWRKKRSIDEDIAANPTGIFVAEIKGSPIGYITTRVDQETKIGWIPNLAVLPEHRKMGIGRKLIDKAVAYLRNQGMKCVRIETLATNEKGQHFYPSYGFKEITRQIHYIMPIDGS